jgi:metallophosphoesterase (TIGR00282 family)
MEIFEYCPVLFPGELLRILMVGDIVGRPGRRAVRNLVPGLRQEFQLDIVIANAENAAGGKGLTPATAEELLRSGIDVLTSGNHIWAQKEIIPYLDGELPILRPLNYSPYTPGRGYLTTGQVLVVNLAGRTFMSDADCPFRTMERLLGELGDNPPAIVIDFHAEATSEKNALGRYLDGRVSAVVGTHTHVGTIDARVLPQGTAYVTDIGMVGPIDSVIGDDVEAVIHRFLTQMPRRLSVGEGSALFNSVLIEIDQCTNRALSITRIDREID